MKGKPWLRKNWPLWMQMLICIKHPFILFRRINTPSRSNLVIWFIMDFYKIMKTVKDNKPLDVLKFRGEKGWKRQTMECASHVTRCIWEWFICESFTHVNHFPITCEIAKRPLRVAAIGDKLRETCLRWFGHLVRKSLSMQFNGPPRERSRPKRTWMEVEWLDIRRSVTYQRI